MRSVMLGPQQGALVFRDALTGSHDRLGDRDIVGRPQSAKVLIEAVAIVTPGSGISAKDAPARRGVIWGAWLGARRAMLGGLVGRYWIWISGQ